MNEVERKEQDERAILINAIIELLDRANQSKLRCIYGILRV